MGYSWGLWVRHRGVQGFCVSAMGVRGLGLVGYSWGLGG